MSILGELVRWDVLASLLLYSMFQYARLLFSGGRQIYRAADPIPAIDHQNRMSEQLSFPVLEQVVVLKIRSHYRIVWGEQSTPESCYSRRNVYFPNCHGKKTSRRPRRDGFRNSSSNIWPSSSARVTSQPYMGLRTGVTVCYTWRSSCRIPGSLGRLVDDDACPANVPSSSVLGSDTAPCLWS